MARLLDPDFVRFLRERSRSIVPFTGAGVSVDAGVPIADKLALQIAAGANERGANVLRREDFAAVCADVTQAICREELQLVIADVIGGLDPRPTPLLRLIARVPSRIVLTSNWDDALERSAREIGKTPCSLEPRMASALREPEDDELYVVHLHGMASAPESIIMPGEFLEALPDDEAFITGVRALLAPHTLLYLGYRFPPEDAYLRDELIWVADKMRGSSDHALLLPSNEYDERIDELAPLREANFQIFTFDSSAGYETVQQAALIFAPQSGVIEGQVARRLDRAPTPYFRSAPLVADDAERTTEELQSQVELARAGFGELPYVEPTLLEEAARALLIGEPGAGKSELLRQLVGRAEPPHLYLRLPEIVATLLDGDVDQAFPRSMAAAAVLRDDVPVPSAEALAGNAYVILLDGFDEIATPEARRDIATRIDEITDRWPQHHFIVASRPVAEREAFPSGKWSTFRLVGDARWGREYLLETRGIPQTRLDDLVAQFPRAGELIAIPLYADLIGERLAANLALPPTALKLITEVAVRDALAREAQREGLAADSVYRFLKTLAAAMELRALNQVPAGELVELPAPDALARKSVRERLVEQALLRDLPGIAAFQAVSVQEALAAEAILETHDPLETLRAVALAEVGGEQVLRPDIDHTLDLLFESADSALRGRLRELDELRFARTQPTTIDQAEAEETLRFIWSFFNRLKIWVDSDRGRELRDARASVERLAAAFPGAIAAMRDELLAALGSDEPTARGNAVFFLDQLEDDPERAEWLRPRLTDTNGVVRRWAAEVVRRHRVLELREPLADAYREDHDELAASALGSALLAIAPESERVQTAQILLENPTGWSRLSYTVRGLPSGEVVEILEAGDLRRWEDEHLLRDALDETPLEGWSEADVERLVALFVRETSGRGVRIRSIDRIADLAARFPAAAMRGAARGVTEETLWIDLLPVLHGVPREMLEGADEGPLEEPTAMILRRLEIEDQQAHAPRTPPEPIERNQPEESLAEWIDSGKLNRERCPDPHGPLDRFLDQVDSLNQSQREALADCANAWWPTRPLSEALTTDGRHGSRPGCFDAALGFKATLDLPLDPQLWLEIFESNGVWFQRRATEWMASHYPGAEVDPRVIAHLRRLADPFLVSLALESLPAISPEVADAAARTLARLDEDASNILDRFRLANQLDALRLLAAEAQSEATRRAARRELAAAGEIEAQRAELVELREAVEGGANLRHGGLSWLTVASRPLLPEIEAVLVAIAHRVGPSEWEVGRTIAAALERLSDQSAVGIYDRLIEDPEAIGAAFYWHQRDALIGEIARRTVLARLPDQLREVAGLLSDLGYPALVNAA